MPKLPLSRDEVIELFSSIFPKLCRTKLAAFSDENGVTTADLVKSSYYCNLLSLRSFKLPRSSMFYDVPLRNYPPASSEGILRSESANG